MRLKNEWINGDCLKELKKLPDESIHLIITSPPYHNLRVYSNDPCDLSNCESYEEYYANSVWHCSVNGFKHTTPMSYEMTRRLVKLYSNPLDTVLDCFGGTGTTNEAAIKSHRNAIGIELSEEFYNKGLERFSLWEEGTLETDDSPQKMIERFNEQLAIGKESKENAEKAKEERKILMQKKKDIRAEIKELEAQLKALGVKAKEIKEAKENALRLFDE